MIDDMMWSWHQVLDTRQAALFIIKLWLYLPVMMDGQLCSLQ